MMMVNGRSQSKQRLEQTVHACCCEQVLSTNDMRHALLGVVTTTDK